jgi:hypothetical protein
LPFSNDRNDRELSGGVGIRMGMARSKVKGQRSKVRSKV